MDLVSAIDLILAILNHTSDSDYQATVGVQEGYVGVHDRWILTLKEISPEAIQMTMRDSEAQRDQQLVSEVRSEAELTATIEAWVNKIEWWRTRLTIWRLQPDKCYRVLQSFKDYYGNTFEVGTLLTYVEQHFLPYHGGYTIVFKEATLYAQEEESALFLNNFDTYVEEVE
jgi:hypothetical protein